MTEDVFKAGHDLVMAADRKAVPLRAAFWVLDAPANAWRLVLEESPPAQLGPLDFAKALHEAVTDIPDERTRRAARDLLLGAVSISTTPHPMAELLRPSLGRASTVLGARLGDTRVGDAIVDGAWLYRVENGQTV